MSFGNPPSHDGTLSAIAPLTAGRGSDAHAGNTIKTIVANASLVIMIVTTRPNHGYSMVRAAGAARFARCVGPGRTAPARGKSAVPSAPHGRGR